MPTQKTSNDVIGVLLFSNSQQKKCDGIFHTVEILDTAGSHHFPAMRELSIRSSRAFVLVFSVDNEQSFYEVMAIWELIVKIKGRPDVPVILVGNKVDLDETRRVPHDVALTFTKESMHCCRYLETSAKYNVNVGQLFSELLMKTFYGDDKHQTQQQRSSGGGTDGSGDGDADLSTSPRWRSSRRLNRHLSNLSLRRKSTSPGRTTAVKMAGNGSTSADRARSRKCGGVPIDYRRCVIL